MFAPTGRDVHRYRALQADITAPDAELTKLLAVTEGQILTTLPGVAVARAAAFAAFSLPIARFPDAEHPYSATGLAPAVYQSATLHRRGRISRQGLAEHRDRPDPPLPRQKPSPRPGYTIVANVGLDYQRDS
jgi:transposase